MQVIGRGDPVEGAWFRRLLQMASSTRLGDDPDSAVSVLAGFLRRGPGGYQPGFVGEYDGLDAVTQAELGQDPADVIERRVAAAVGEMAHVGEFDFVIINNNLQEALDDLCAAVRASRLRFPRQAARHPDVFRFLNTQ